MQSVKNDFNTRVEEIEKYFHLLYRINSGAQIIFSENEVEHRERIDVALSSTLKSASILLLYNLVESTISNCIKEIHNVFCTENLLYNQLSDNLQKLWLNHYFQNISKGKFKDDEISGQLKIIIDTWVHGQTIDLTYENITKYKTGSQFSGNLDSKSIRRIADRYGIDFDIESPEVKTIRDKRNKLAHGELSFSDCCNQDSYQYMNNLKEKTIYFLNEFIISTEDFIQNRKFER